MKHITTIETEIKIDDKEVVFYVSKNFKPFEIASGFIELRKYLRNYPNLKEETNEPVSQAEDTVIVLDSGNIKTT